MRATRASLLARAGSAATVAVLATGGVIATTTAADAATHHHKLLPTTLSIKNKAIAHGKHHADAVTGVLRSHRKDVAGETITLDSRTGKKPRWTVVTTGMTGTDGSVTFTVAPTARTQYKLVFSGDSTYRKSHSNVITLKVAKADNQPVRLRDGSLRRVARAVRHTDRPRLVLSLTDWRALASG